MSNLKDYIDWLEKSIAEEHIMYYKYSDFKNMQPIESGSYGSVARVMRKNRLYALKSFYKNKITLKEVINEVQHL